MVSVTRRARMNMRNILSWHGVRSLELLEDETRRGRSVRRCLRVVRTSEEHQSRHDDNQERNGDPGGSNPGDARWIIPHGLVRRQIASLDDHGELLETIGTCVRRLCMSSNCRGLFGGNGYARCEFCRRR